jgi:copper chaperone CopZ
MAKTVLVIEGMTCPMCAQGIAATLKRVEGVTDAVIDIKKGTGEITHNGVKDEVLIRAVLDLGYKSKVKTGFFK